MTGLDSETTVRLDDRVYRTDLEGGPVVVSERLPGVRSVALGIFVRWGSSHEPRQRLGISHLLEHMVFKGTRNRTARDIALEIESLGGSLDAYTAREHTAYHARVLDEHFPIAVEVLSDLVFNPLLRERDLVVERNVILEEIAGVEDTPEEFVFELHARSLWGDHPYGNPVLGTMETVSAISSDDLRALQESVYRPAACIVAAAGNLDHGELIQQVSRVFPANGAPVEDPRVPVPPQREASVQRVERDSAQVHLCLGRPTFPHSDARRHALILLSNAVGGGMSSRLFQRVREEQGLAYAVYSYTSFYARGGLKGVYVATRPDTADRALEELCREYAALTSEGLSPGELEAVKNQAKGQLVLALESTTGRLQRLAAVALYDEPYRTLDELCATIDGVTSEDVADLCKTYYPPERQTVVRLGPASG